MDVFQILLFLIVVFLIVVFPLFSTIVEIVFRSPSFKGWLGERQVANILTGLDPSRYLVFNNLYLSSFVTGIGSKTRFTKTAYMCGLYSLTWGSQRRPSTRWCFSSATARLRPASRTTS